VADAIGEATVVARSPSVVTAEVDGELVVMSIEHGRYFGLDAVGTEIWRRIEPPCSFADLIEALAADYDADRATIAAGVRSLLARMLAQDVVRLT
jgi:Coenzyme PQQ synthesis protein D (PqqD)